MCVELRQDFLEQFELLSRHSLHNKASIMAKEEETPACTCCFASLKYLISVGQWIQRLFDLLKANIVHGSQPLKDASRESLDFSSWQRIAALFFTRASQFGGR